MVTPGLRTSHTSAQVSLEWKEMSVQSHLKCKCTARNTEKKDTEKYRKIQRCRENAGVVPRQKTNYLLTTSCRFKSPFLSILFLFQTQSSGNSLSPCVIHAVYFKMNATKNRYIYINKNHRRNETLFASFFVELCLPRFRMCLLIMVDNGRRKGCLYQTQQNLQVWAFTKKGLLHPWESHLDEWKIVCFRAGHGKGWGVLVQDPVHYIKHKSIDLFVQQLHQVVNLTSESHNAQGQSVITCWAGTCALMTLTDESQKWLVFALTGFSGSSHKPPEWVKIRHMRTFIDETNQLTWRKEGKVHLALCIQTQANDV